MATSTSTGKIETYLGAKAESLLGFNSPKISRDRLHLPGPDFIDRIWAISDRNIRVLTNLQRMFGRGRLANTGYLSISAGRPGHRTFRRRQLREKSRLFRRGKYRQAGHGRRVQCCGLDLRRPRRRSAQVCAQNSLHRKNES